MLHVENVYIYNVQFAKGTKEQKINQQNTQKKHMPLKRLRL